MRKITSALDDFFVKEAVGSRGPLPENMTYHHVPEINSVTGEPTEHNLYAVHHPTGNMTDPNEPDRQPAGVINWLHQGPVQWIQTEPEFERRGVATEMWRRAKEIDPKIQHGSDAENTDLGNVWKRTVGD